MMGTTTTRRWADITEPKGQAESRTEGPGDRPAPPSFRQSTTNRAIQCGNDVGAMIV
jgi:hypothetical protein